MKTAEAQVVATWTAGPFLYGVDSRERYPNPDFHPPISLLENGRLVDGTGTVVKDAPAYIVEAAKTLLKKGATPMPEKVEMTLATAMQQSQGPANDAPPAPPAPVKRGRGRPRKVQ